MDGQLLVKLSDSNLITEIKNLVGEERKVIAQVLRYLCEVRRRRLFALYGYPSLFMFCVKFLGYTESQTQRRLEAMKVISQVSEVEVKIQEGSLSLTAVAQAQSYFRSQEKAERIKSLLSHKNPNMTQSELLNEMAEIVLNKIDPLRKEIKQRNASMASIVTSKVSMSLRRQTFHSDKGKCSFVSPITSEKCESQFLLEVDHIIPKALGGQGTKENLRLLCHAHNQHAATQVFGRKKMEKHLGTKR